MHQQLKIKDKRLRINSFQDGFVALVSVIIIFAILLVLVALIATSSFFTRFNVLDYENKKVSVALAEACVETALVNLAKDPVNYPLGIPIPQGRQETIEFGKTCRICPIGGSNPNFIIYTRSSYNNAYANLTINASLTATNFTITSWDESLTFPAGCVLP